MKIGSSPRKFFAADANAKLVAANSAKLLKWNLSLLQHGQCLLQVFGPDGNDDPRLRLVKKRCSGGRVACFKINLHPEEVFRVKTTFSKCNRETAFAALTVASY